MTARFTIGGNRLPLEADKNVDCPNILGKLGLTSYEVAGGHGLNMSSTTVRSMKHAGDDNGVAITVHGMYSASMMSKAKVDYTRLYHYLNNGMFYAENFGGKAVIFHTGGATEKDETQQLIRTINVLKYTLSFSKYSPSLIYLETMDGNCFGTFAQLMKMSEEIGTRVCVDWTHIWARAKHSNRPFNKKEVRSILKELERTDWNWECYFHISGATISPKGEAIHYNLKDSDFPYEMVLTEIMSSKVGGRIIVESGADYCTDALLVKEFINS